MIESKKSESMINDVLDDLKLRVDILKFDQEKKRLNDLESNLNDLRSEDLKTQDLLFSTILTDCSISGD